MRETGFKNNLKALKAEMRTLFSLAISLVFALNLGIAASSAETTTTVFLWSTKYNSEIAFCPKPYESGLEDSYDSVSIDSHPSITAPTDVLTISVDFSQDCYDPNGLKYQRKLSLLSPSGEVIELTKDPKLSRSRERTYSIYCYLITGGCWWHTDVYQVRLGSTAPSGNYGLRFDTTYLDTVCSSVNGASVCERNVSQSKSFDLPTLFNVTQTGTPAPWESGEEVTGEMLLQRAGSQVFLTSDEMSGSFHVLEDGQVVDQFEFGPAVRAHIVEKRLTGEIKVQKLVNGKALDVPYKDTKGLLWFENVNLGSFSETRLSDAAWLKVSYLAEHKFLYSGVWLERDSRVTKFICTGIYREGASAAEKLAARKRAKLACDLGEKQEIPNKGNISFFYQTKPTKAPSYVGKVLVTVKGIEPFVASRLK